MEASPGVQGREQGSSFGRLGEGDAAGDGAAREGGEGGEENDWQKLLGVPAGKASRSTKRARVSASQRMRQPPRR